MCRDLYKDVINLLTHSSSFIRKKACMASVRIVRKCHDLIEDFLVKVSGLMEDRSHGVLIGTVTLAI
jgi:AP-1 complex subunit gamma-1